MYKVEDRPTLLYGSETWVTTKREDSRITAAAMRFLRGVQGYRRIDRIRNSRIRDELQIIGIVSVRDKYKQNWIDHLERMEDPRLPKYALNYKPKGKRDRGRPRGRWQNRILAGTGLTA